ncbi:MAG: mechanosensitive ion channel family protein [Haloarculaceae archaeon]
MQSAFLTELWEALLALPAWQGFLVVVGCSLVVAFLVQVGGDFVIRRVTTRIPGDIDAIILHGLHPPLYVTVVLVGGYLGLEVLDVFAAWLPELRAALLSLLTVMWVFVLTRLGRRVSDEATRDDRFNNQVVPIFQNVWTALVLGVGAFLVLSVWNVDVTPLLASAGVLGIVLGLAARDTIANFFGSIALYFDRTYTVGDFIVLESGERGRVEDVSIRSTDIRTRDDILVTVPNAKLNTATVINESSPERERRLRVSLGVAYDSDLEHVEDVLLDVARDADVVIDEPRPRVRVREFAASSVNVDLLAWIPAPVLRGRARHRLLKRIHATFREEDIEIPFPQRVVTMPDEDPGEDGRSSGFTDERVTDSGEGDGVDR